MVTLGVGCSAGSNRRLEVRVSLCFQHSCISLGNGPRDEIRGFFDVGNNLIKRGSKMGGCFRVGKKSFSMKTQCTVSLNGCQPELTFFEPRADALDAEFNSLHDGVKILGGRVSQPAREALKTGVGFRFN